MTDENSLSNRRRIFQFISRHPGAYLRELQRELDLQVGVLQHHLTAMRSNGMLRTEDDGYRKRYFASAALTSDERKMMSLIRLRTPRRIVIHLLRHGAATPQDLCDAMDVTKGAVSFQMKRLVANGIVAEAQEGRKKVYRLNDPPCAKRLLVMYRSTLADSVVDSLVHSWLNIR